MACIALESAEDFLKVFVKPKLSGYTINHPHMWLIIPQKVS